MHGSLQSLSADPGEINYAVSRVSVKFSSRTVLSGESVVQRSVSDMCQSHRLEESCLEIGVEVGSCNLLDHKAQDHVVDVGVERFRTGFIHKRGHADSLNGRIFRLLVGSVSDKQFIGALGIKFLLLRIEMRVKIARVRGESSLMAEKVSESEGLLPLLLHFNAGVFPFFIVDLDRILVELRAEIIADAGVQVQIAVCYQLLQRVIDAEHLGDGSEII